MTVLSFERKDRQTDLRTRNARVPFSITHTRSVTRDCRRLSLIIPIYLKKKIDQWTLGVDKRRQSWETIHVYYKHRSIIVKDWRSSPQATKELPVLLVTFVG